MLRTSNKDIATPRKTINNKVNLYLNSIKLNDFNNNFIIFKYYNIGT